MSRPVFSFRPNLQNARHERAWEILSRVPEGQKNQYLVDAILKMADGEWIKQVVLEAVRDGVKGDEMEHPMKQKKEEIPDSMMEFLFRMEQEERG